MDKLDFSNMVNKRIDEIVVTSDRRVITFFFEDGFQRSFYVESDCCSNTWIEHLEVPLNTIGATLLSVEDSAPITQNHDAHDTENQLSNSNDCFDVYNTSFKTERGEIILEYRTASNGAYGGHLRDYTGPAIERKSK